MDATRRTPGPAARRVGWLGACLAVSLLLIACGGDSVTPTPASSPTGVASPSPSPPAATATATAPPPTPTAVPAKPTAAPTAAAKPAEAVRPTALPPKPTAAKVPANPTPAKVPAKPTAPPAAPVFSAVVPAKPGGTASATVKTVPSSACKLTFAPPANGPRSELGSKIAPASGVVAWSWPIAPTTKVGNGTLTVTCAGQSASKPIKIG